MHDQANKTVIRPGIPMFDRVLRFYRAFDIIAAFPAIIALVIMVFGGLRDHQKADMAHALVLLLASAVVTSIIAITLSKILLFKFERNQHLAERRSTSIWLPTILVDISIVEVLVGFVFWIANSYAIWVAILIGVEALVLLIGIIALAWKIWKEELALQSSGLDLPEG
ncbi:hypothetical protein B0T10DRAFT_466533 [Thelonectria olida]|uniref:Transmembrane protein n=1 Tax=Thelonectria olida TaxID=1576542 RepID=A0A9P9AHR5_9HYPO|nr:hypothetical protein B0T10DRAFT_466533 [Thelonectria olida]